MKKAIYLISILAVLFVTACDPKDDPINDDPIDEGLITLAELDGTWNFQRYIYGGEIFNFENSPGYMSSMFIDFKFDVENMTFVEPNWTYTFTKEGNNIEVQNGNSIRYKFTVLEYDGVELHLKINDTSFSYNYFGGTLVVKQ